MDYSLREASRKKQSIAPNKTFFGPIRTKKRPNSLHKSSYGVQKTA